MSGYNFSPVHHTVS